MTDLNGNLIDDNGNIVARENERTKTIKFTRVVGFIRPTDSFNDGKKEEFKERRSYAINEFRD